MLGCRDSLWVVAICGLLAPAFVAVAADNGTIPTADEVARMLSREPITADSWPAWRTRLLSWMNDHSKATDAAFAAARTFVKGQANASGGLSGQLANDSLAWYLLGRVHLDDYRVGGDRGPAGKAEKAFRRSIELDDKLAQAHRNLALAILLQQPPIDPEHPPIVRPPLSPRRDEALRELAKAHAVDPKLPLKWVEAQGAFVQQCYPEAERLFREALEEDPGEEQYAVGAGVCIISDPLARGNGKVAPRVQSLLDRFPNSGSLVSVHAVALAVDGNLRGAVAELKHARQLGTDPATVFAADLVRKIEEEGAPGLLEQFAWLMGGFAALYAAAMLTMALAGLVLAGRTRGARALDLVGAGDDLVADGQVVRAGHESMLARLYAFGLFAGLILFYLSIPFVLAGLLALTGGLLFLIFQLPRIPIKLIAVVVIVGLGGIVAVLKSLFAAPARGGFGLAKTSEQCPKLYQALTDVASRVDTSPVDQVYIAPGSGIGVHQEGRGPFGVFGVKRRVLTLGLSTMHFLTVGELKSILAHEYAHFSHADTFYNRFIYQVNLSIQQALNGMAASGGTFNYVNPFYWFLYLYYRSYNLLSAGFSRSREFLADRMAASLYGPSVFSSALTKVSTDGTLFEMTIYDNIGKLLDENKSFVNMYSAFRDFRDEQIDKKDREELYAKLLEEKESLFASHPTFKERIDAVAQLPTGQAVESARALELFDDPEALEKELTEFMTAYVYHMRQMAAAAQAA